MHRASSNRHETWKDCTRWAAHPYVAHNCSSFPDTATLTRTPRNRTRLRAAWQCIQEFRSGRRSGPETGVGRKIPLNWSRTACESRMKHVSPYNGARHFLLATGYGILVGRVGSSTFSAHHFTPIAAEHRKVAARGADSTVQASRRSAVNCPVSGMRIGMKAGQHARTEGRFGISGSPLSLRWSLTRCVPGEQWQPWEDEHHEHRRHITKAGSWTTRLCALDRGACAAPK